jgi:hypothetical protein
MHAREIKPQGMPRNLFRVWGVPRSLIAQRVKILPVLFRSLARSTSEPVVGYAKRRPSFTLGKFDASMGAYKRKITIGG